MRKNKFQIILLIITIILGVLNLKNNIWGKMYFGWINVIIAFIPMVITIVVIVKKKEIKKKSIIKGFICLYIVNLIGTFYGQLVLPRTGVINYKKVININTESEALKHFPIEIPKSAKGVKVNCFPGFLQAKFLLNLEYSTTQEEIDEIQKEFEPKAIMIIRGDEDSTDNSKYVASSIREFVGMDREYGYISDSIVIYRIDPNKSEWNGGVQYGIAINKSTNTVLYFYDGC